MVETSFAITHDEAFNQTMREIHEYGLEDNLNELEVLGYTTLKSTLDSITVERAKSAILSVMEKRLTRTIDPEREDDEDLNGITLAPYLFFEDQVFEDIVTAAKPLALISYLLGRSARLSSMTCHFKARGGRPLNLHSDNGNGIPAPYGAVSQVANVNYALTPYAEEHGALVMIPGSHRYGRQPRAEEMRMLEDHHDGSAVAMNLEPGDCVVWHGNTWHGSLIRKVPGIRMNLAVYFCRQYIVTQERFNEYVPEELKARHANNSRLLTLLGGKQAYGWQAEGPDWSKLALQPRGLFD